MEIETDQTAAQVPRRRSRRRRRYQAVPLPYYMVEMPDIPNTNTPNEIRSCSWSFFSAIYNIFVLGTLIGLIYMIFDHQCYTYMTRHHLSNVTNHVEELQHHLSVVKDNYLEIESKISQISHDLKVDGQMGMLELMKTQKELKNLATFDPTTNFVFVPNVDMYYNNDNHSSYHDVIKNRVRRILHRHF